MMVHVSAFREAREQVKMALKRQGFVVSHYPAAQRSEFAKQLLAANREQMLAEARARIMASPRLQADWERACQKYEAAMARRKSGPREISAGAK
jgi:hypothetical protein